MGDLAPFFREDVGFRRPCLYPSHLSCQSYVLTFRDNGSKEIRVVDMYCQLGYYSNSPRHLDLYTCRYTGTREFRCPLPTEYQFLPLYRVKKLLLLSNQYSLLILLKNSSISSSSHQQAWNPRVLIGLLPNWFKFRRKIYR